VSRASACEQGVRHAYVRSTFACERGVICPRVRSACACGRGVHRPRVSCAFVGRGARPSACLNIPWVPERVVA